MQRAQVIALFGPTGVGKTAIAIALAGRLRARGERPVAVSCDALQVYSGLEIADRRRHGQRAFPPRTPPDLVPARRRDVQRRPVRGARARPDRRAARRAAQRPIVVGGTGLYLRAALTELSLRPPPLEGVRERWEAELDARAARRAHAVLPTALLAPRRASTRPTASASCARSSCSTRASSSRRERESELWTDDVRRPTLPGRPRDGPRAALRADRRPRRRRWSPPAPHEEVRRANVAGASVTARKALGFEELLAAMSTR